MTEATNFCLGARRSAAAVLIVTVALAPLLLGCGTLDRDAVQTEVQNVESAAAEGSLVAREVEKGRTFRSFSEIRTAELHKVAMTASEALQETPAEAGLSSAARRGADLGERVREVLERLHKRPTDRAVAHDVRLALERLAAEADELGTKL
jgi:hypothetical protein